MFRGPTLIKTKIADIGALNMRTQNSETIAYKVQPYAMRPLKMAEIIKRKERFHQLRVLKREKAARQTLEPSSRCVLPDNQSGPFPNGRRRPYLQ